MHRCGTSLLSQCVTKNGFSIGKTKNKDKDWQNPNGYFENDAFTKIHEELLNFNNSSWHSINKDGMVYNKEHVIKYRQSIENEFKDKTKIIIKDPRLTFFVDFLKEVCLGNHEYNFIFCTRTREECCESLCGAQNISKEKSYDLYDKTHNLYSDSFLMIDHNDLIYKNSQIMKEIFSFIGMKKDTVSTSDLVDLKLYRNRFKG